MRIAAHMPMPYIVKVNTELWSSASRVERHWIHTHLVVAGLMKNNTVIEAAADAELLEIAEIDQRIKRLEAKHGNSGCAGRCREAYTEAMRKCAGIAFSDQRKRYKNVAYQAYALCLRGCRG